MGDALAFLAFVGLVVGLIGLFNGSVHFLGIHRPGHGAGVMGASVVLLLAIGQLNDRTSEAPPPVQARPASDQVRATLRSYLQTHATIESASVSNYEPSPDQSSLVVKTNLPSNPQSLEAARTICEMARNVIGRVQVNSVDGTALWTCDHVNTAGNRQLAVLAQAATTAPTTTTVPVSSTRATTRPRAVGSTRPPAAATTQAAQAASGCHPSYLGECLPADAFDVDCLGGRGNGPVFAHNRDIPVVGPDEYGLDADDDGFGCDSPQHQDSDPLDDTDPPDEEPAEPTTTTTTEPPSAPTCHPSYEGECLPPDASDVDCVDGSGDGPVYAQTRDIQIVGPDVYDLDRDGDNLGCDS